MMQYIINSNSYFALADKVQIILSLSTSLSNVDDLVICLNLTEKLNLILLLKLHLNYLKSHWKIKNKNHKSMRLITCRMA